MSWSKVNGVLVDGGEGIMVGVSRGQREGVGLDVARHDEHACRS